MNGGRKKTAENLTSAIFDYSANGPDELTFKKGDVITILSTSTQKGCDSGWMRGQLANGTTGMYVLFKMS